jgi:hypothetical protein
MPKQQLHKRFTIDQVKIIFQWYEDRALNLREARSRLEISEQRFFQLLAAYRKNPDSFSIAYPSRVAHNRTPHTTDTVIREELEKERVLIANRDMPVHQYNYAAVRDEVRQRIQQNISDETIRRRAHDWGFVTAKPLPKKHDRVVQTTAVGMIFQHDASEHLWTPYAQKKWQLITTLDDYSRKLLYADFFEHQTVWAHIEAVESVVLKYGAGLAYYVDSHSIFRFVCYRDSIWYHQAKGTDDVMTQWKRVVETCGMKVWHASSPQAKGKIERPYRWLQDRIVRRCAKEGIKTIEDGRKILQEEVERYNTHQVHSTTKEIPDIRFERAIRENNSVLKPFIVPAPFTSTKDIFCLREKRVVDGYRKVSWRKYLLSVPADIPVGAEIELHIIPDPREPEIRLWFKDKVVAVAKIKPRRQN